MVLNSHSGSEKLHASHEGSTSSLQASVPISEPVSPHGSTAFKFETSVASSSKLPELFQRMGQGTKRKRDTFPLSQSVADPSTSPRIKTRKAFPSTPRSAPTLLGDSPAKARLAVLEEYRSDYVTEQRKAIMEQLGATVPWGTSDYRSSIIPLLRPEFDIDRISDYLIANGNLKKKGGSYVWRDFEKKLNATENVIYNKPLENVFNAIIDAARETSGIKEAQTLLLLTDGNRAPWSLRGSAIKPDGFLVLQDSSEAKENSTLWYNIAACFAFKTNRHSNDEYENITQAIHSMQHVLAIDPCRRFTYGFNVEKTRIKLWIATRAMVISCASFDFQTQYKELIRLFLSLSFASKEELGWDMTVKPELEGDGRSYDYEVAGEHFYTSEKDMIVGDKATDILGSGTRIWHARKGSKESRDEVVIKDYWPSEDRETEDVLHRMILDDIKDVEKRQFFIEHTLNPIAAESVRACGSEDNTKKTILRGKSPDLSTLYKFPVPASKGAYKDKTGNLPGMEASLKTEGRRLVRELEKNERTSYYHRKHHRIVYKEVATPFYKLRNTKEMYIVLVDALKTLLILHEAGWVHRDISAGNLYLYEDPVSKVKRGLVGDFEYAKKVGWGGQHDIRTGTPNFMAVEIALQNHLFIERNEVDSFDDFFSSDEDDEPRGKSYNVSKGGVFFNYIHDLESLWWIIVWVSFVYVKSPVSTDEGSLNNTLRQRKQYYSLFPGDTSTDEREGFLKQRGIFEYYLESVPHDFNTQSLLITAFRRALHFEYSIAEADISRPTRFPVTSDRKWIHDTLLHDFLEYVFEDMDVIPVLEEKEERSSHYDQRGIKRQADDGLQSSAYKRSRQY